MEYPLSLVVLLGLLIAIAILFACGWIYSLLQKKNEWIVPSWYQCVVGFITDFLDTWGIGSFAVTTALYRLGRIVDRKNIVDDANLPGTLNVGHTLPTILQALIYTNVVKIDMWTLWLLIISSVVGSYIGASLVSKLPKRPIQIGMAVALLIAVVVLITKLYEWKAKGGDALGLSGNLLIIGMIGNFIFGALMTIGIGAYAPIMVMVSLLGMNDKTAFPLMMGSCAFLMPVASYKFIRSGKYDVKAAIGLTTCGLIGVPLAAFVVQKMGEKTIQVLVVIVVIYTALMLLYSALKDRSSDTPTAEVD